MRRSAFLAAVSLLLLGCDLVATSHDPTPADFEETTKTSELTPPKNADGEPCRDASECASNACVDVVLLHHALGGRCARTL